MTHYMYTVIFFTIVKPGPLVKPRGLKASFGYIGLTIVPFWKWNPSRLMWFIRNIQLAIAELEAIFLRNTNHVESSTYTVAAVS